MNVVIVESAAKAKTINKYLGSGFKVIPSYGHVRDLPSKDGSVEPANDFAMHWDVDGKAAKVMKEIAAAVKTADKLILATDPDREGEAISWHILRVLEEKRALKKGVPVERVTFNAVTKQAVLDAMKAPRQIETPLVEAYLARRALDYLVGFTLSPVLWRKLPGARSAGRVQSVALRLVCDREAEIEAFKTEEYWTIEATAGDGEGRGRSGPSQYHRRTQAREARHQGCGLCSRHQGCHRERRLPQSHRSRRRPFGATRTHLSPPRRCSRKPRASSASRRDRPCRWRSACTKASTSAARRSGSLPICEPTACRSLPRPSRRSGASWSGTSASATCRRSSASTRPRPRTPRKRTRRSGRRTYRARPMRWPSAWSATRRGCTNSCGSGPWRARWHRPSSSRRRQTSTCRAATARPTASEPPARS